MINYERRINTIRKYSSLAMRYFARLILPLYETVLDLHLLLSFLFRRFVLSDTIKYHDKKDYDKDERIHYSDLYIYCKKIFHKLAQFFNRYAITKLTIPKTVFENNATKFITQKLLSAIGAIRTIPSHPAARLINKYARSSYIFLFNRIHNSITKKLISQLKNFLTSIKFHYLADLRHWRRQKRSEGKIKKYGRYVYTVVIVLVVAFVLGRSWDGAAASWWSDRWGYRMAITVPYSGTTTLTDFQVKIAMSDLGVDALKSAGKLQSDCADLRFTSASGQPLPYWIEDISDTNDLDSASCTNTNGAVWVKVSSIQTGGATIYAYYGNPIAQSESNGENTFEFFDGFGGSTVDTGKWTTTGGTWSQSSSVLSQTDTAATNAIIYSANYLAPSEIVVQTRLKANSTTSNIGAGLLSQYTDVNNYYHLGYSVNEPGTDVLRNEKRLASTFTQEANYTVTTDITNYHTLRVDLSNSTVYPYFDGSLNGTGWADTSFRGQKIGLRTWTMGVSYDYLFTRKYASTSPSTPSAGSEQTQASTGNAAPVAYWPLTKDTFDAGTSSLADLAGSADAGEPPVLHLTMDDGDIDEHSCPDGGAVAGACDVSGNGNHGTANGTMTDSDYVAGKIGSKALEFDGSDDYVDMGSGLDLVGDLTMGAWVKTSSTDKGTVISKGTNNDHLYVMYIVSGGYLGCSVFQTNSNSSYLEADSSAIVSDGQWHYLSCTLSGDSMTAYIDGVVDGTDSSPAGTRDVSVVGNAHIGNFSPSWYSFNGNIDEVKIYNYARTPEQIKADYNNTKAYFGSAGAAPSYIGIVPGTGTIPNQSVLQFDGVDDYLTLGNETIGRELKGASASATSLWIKPNAFPSAGNYYQLIGAIGNAGAAGPVDIKIDENHKIQVGGRSTTGDSHQGITSIGTINSSEWTHVLGVLDFANDTVSIYINGVLDNSGSATFGSNTYSPGTPTGPDMIGNFYGTSRYVNGSIAGVKIFDYALSADQVKYQYAAGIEGSAIGSSASVGGSHPELVSGSGSLSNGLVGHWKLDGDAQDSSGNNNNGTLNNFTAHDDPTSGMLSQSGLTAFNATTTVDDDISPGGLHTDSSSAGAYLKIDLGSGNEKPYVKSRFYAQAGYNGVWDIQYSDDDTTYYTAAQNFNPDGAGWHEISWDYVGSHRYWRLYLTNTPGSGSYLNELEMYKAVFDEGKLGQGLHFDGTGDYINLGSGVGDYIDTFTVSSWFKTSVKNVRPAISRRDGSNTQYDLYIHSTTGYLSLYDGASSFYGSTDVSDNEWHFGVWVINGSESKIYVDGEYQVQFSPSITSRSVNANIGSYNDGANGPFNGSLDDVRIYNRALSATEIEDLYLSGGDKVAGYEFAENSGVVAGDSSGYDNNLTKSSDVILSNSEGSMWEPGRYSSAVKLDGVDDSLQSADNIGGLVGWWTMDETSWNGTSGEVKDLGSTGNTGTAECDGTYDTCASGVPSTVAGQMGKAGNFSESGQAVAIDNTGEGALEYITESIWINPSTINQAGVNGFLSHLGASDATAKNPTITTHARNRLWLTTTGAVTLNSLSYTGSLNCSNYTIGEYLNNTITSTSPLSIGTWNLVTYTLDYGGDDNVIEGKLYINGKQENSFSISNRNCTNQNTYTWVGKRKGSGSVDFLGQIDDYRMYNRILSADEISNLYNSSKLSPTNSVSVEVMVKPAVIDSGSGSGMTTGGVIASKGNNYKLSAISHPELVSGSSAGSRSSFSTDTITSQLSGTNINDIFYYDTTTDTIDNSWRFDTTKSWYSETIDATYAACNVATHDRCGTKYFPEKAYIVATDNNVYIFDAEENAMWMRFIATDGYLYDSVSGGETLTAKSVFALNSKLYFATKGTSTYGFLDVADFINDIGIRYGDTGSMTGSQTLSSIGVRNGGSTWATGGNGVNIVESMTNDVHAAVISGKTYVAVATDGGVSVINETDGSVANFTNGAGGGSYDVSKNVFFAKNGDLYFTQDVSQRALWAFYQSNSKWSTGTTSVPTYANMRYNTGQDGWSGVGVNTTPGLWNVNSTAISSLYVTAGTSTIDGTSNTIYVGHSKAVAIIQEKQGDESNGSVKYVTKDYISEEMTGDIRGMWPMYGTSGAAIANNTYNVDDVSVKSSELTAKNANGTGMSYVDGVRGTAINFDGTDDYLCTDTNDDGTCDDDTDLDITGNLTVGAWVKKDSNNFRTILSKGDSTATSNDRGVFLGYGYGTTCGSNNAFVFGALNLTNEPCFAVSDFDEWHFVVGVYDGSSRKLYVDGDYKSQSTANLRDFNNPYPFRISGHLTSGSTAHPWDGSIDEPFVTAEVLSADQIKHMYEVGKRALTADGESELNGTSNQVNAVAASGMYTYEDSSNIQHPTSSILMAGTEGGGVSVIDLSSDTLTKAYTTTSTPAISHANINAIWPTTGGNFVTATDSGMSRLNDVSGIQDLTSNIYTHIAGVHDTTDGYLKLYENGVLVGRTNVGTGASPVTNSSPLVVGGVIPASWSADNSSAIAVNNFYGSIDGANVYDYAMTPRDVNLSYGNGQGQPVLYMPFDEGQGVVAHNQSWQKVGETTNLVTNPSFETGTTGWAEVGNPGSFTRVSTSSNSGSFSIQQSGYEGYKIAASGGKNNYYTISAWVKVETNTNNQALNIRALDSGNNSILVIPLPSGMQDGNWHRLSASAYLTADIVNIQIGATSVNSGGTTIVDWDEIQLEQSGSPTPYCDGSLTGSGTYAWNGTAHASTSTCTYGADGDVYGATWQNSGAKGGSLRFDGTGDWVDSQKGGSMEIYEDITVNAWMKMPPVSAVQVPISKYGALSSGDNGWMFVLSDTGTVSFDGRDGSEVYRQTSDSGEIDDNKWHLVTGQRQGSIWKIFVDGVLESQTDVGYSGNINAPLHKFIVGAQSSNHLYPYTGDIDEVKIFPYALSSSEVKAQYNFGTGLKLGAPVGASHDSPADDDGLVGHWKMDEASANTCSGGTNDSCDSSGNGNDGAWVGNSTSATGKYGNGVTFDGTGDYINVPDTSVLQMSSKMSVSAWVKLSVLATDRRIVDKTNNGTGYALVSNSGTPQFITGNGSTYDILNATTTMTTGIWYQVAGLVDTGVKKIYVNGVLEAQSSITFVGTGVGTSFKVGDRNGTVQGVTGVIDDVRIYNRALDATEIRNMYLLGPGPVAHWDFDENDGTVAHDTAASHPELGSGSNNGVLTNGPTWVPGVKGSALSFDGSDDYMEVPDLSETIDGSISLWFNNSAIINSGSGRQGLILNDGTGTPSMIMAFNADESTGKLQFAINGGGWYRAKSDATSWAPGSWHNVVGMWSDDGVKLYVDGLLQTTSDSFAGSPSPESNNWWLGSDANYFNGLIDDVKIYNYALTPYQIAKEFNGGAPVAHYAFDEGDGQAVHNTGGINQTRLNDHSTSLDGYLGDSATTTTYDPAWVLDETACKVGKCLDFAEGSGQGVYVPYNSSFNFGDNNSFTLSSWVNRSAGATNYDSIISKGGQTNSTPGYQLFINPDSTVTLRQTWSGGPLYGQGASSTQVLTRNQWYLITYVVNENTQTVSIYFDGKLEKTVDTSSVGDISSVTDMQIGKGGAGALDGSIDDVKIFNYALSPEDVAREYNMGAAVRFGN